MKILDNVPSLLETVRDTVRVYSSTAGTSSIVELANVTRMEPLTIVSSSLRQVKPLYDILQGTLNLYTSYYLQAVSVLSAGISDTKILRVLDSLNPNRSISTLLASYGTENHVEVISTPKSVKERHDKMRRYYGLEGLEYGARSPRFLESTSTGLESNRDFYLEESARTRYELDQLRSDEWVNTADHRRAVREAEIAAKEAAAKAAEVRLEFAKEQDYQAAVDRAEKVTKERLAEEALQKKNNSSRANVSRTKVVNDFENFEQVVGKIVEITVSMPDGTNTVTLPTVVKLDTVIVPTDVVSDLVTFNEESIRIGSRFMQAMSGRIDFFRDFILAEDLIKKHKRGLIKDPTQATKTLLDRISKAQVMGALSKNPSLNAISAVIVISDEEERAIKSHIGGDLSNPKTRAIVFDNTQCAIIVSIHREWEEVTFYVRGMDNYSTIPFSRFKSKGGNDDVITELFKSMSTGRVPTF